MRQAYTRDMIHILCRIIDIIFPPSDSLIAIRSHVHLPITSFYRKEKFLNITTLAHYQNSYIKACVIAGKFEYNLAALKRLGLLLDHHLTLHHTDFPSHSTLLVPVPLHRERQFKRGYNQVEIICKQAKAYQTKTLLKKVINTKPQSHQNRDDRLKNLKDAFIITNAHMDWATITNVVLVDDVTTTGSTLQAAERTLRPHLPKHVQLSLLAIAH
jgi:ComF family protein